MQNDVCIGIFFIEKIFFLNRYDLRGRGDKILDYESGNGSFEYRRVQVNFI